MGKEAKSEKEKEKRAEKKRLKEEKVSNDGVKKEKKDKKEKKAKKEKLKDVTETLINQLEEDPEEASKTAIVKTTKDEDTENEVLVGALVPFANPLADDKQTKSILKSVKKATKAKSLKRGVKEVVKSLRKSTTSAPSSSAVADPLGIVILAADISPMDVISHIPVLCEDHNIPYIYVKSRAELGAASATKRPTSVVMLTKEKEKKSKEKVDEDTQKEYLESYRGLVALANKAALGLKV